MIRAALLAAGLGLIAVAVSELLFYPVHLGPVPGVVAFYAASVLLALAIVERTGAAGWAAAVLGAAIFGWLIEGVVVTQAYEGVPWTLSWTPLAWHGVFSFALGLVGLRRGLMARRGWVAALAAAAVGLVCGTWGAFGWQALMPETGGPVTQGFAVQALVLTGMLAAGHWLLDLAPEGPPVPRPVLWGLAGLAALIWAASWALPLFPVSLTVPALVALSVAALVRLGGGGGARAWRFGRVPPRRYLALALVPAVAIPVQALLFGNPAALVAEMNVFVAVPAVIVSTLAWAAAVLRGLRRG